MWRLEDDLYRPYHVEPRAEVSRLGALAIVPAPKIHAIEQVRLAGYPGPLDLVTKRSFLIHQNTNEQQYSQRIAQHTWAIINKCTPGTADAERCRQKYLDNGAPELSYYGVVDEQERTLAGVYPGLFSDLVEDLRDQRNKVPQLAAASLNFLHNLAEIVETELQD